LLRHSVPDRYLAPALDRLARQRAGTASTLSWIDYGELEVRLLGSLCERLLECKLKVAEGDPPQGRVYLSRDPAKRKATGSYYTPDAIVDYLVRHTVGPVLDEKLRAIQEEFRKLRPRNDRQDLLDRLFDFRVLDPAMGSGHFLV